MPAVDTLGRCFEELAGALGDVPAAAGPLQQARHALAAVNEEYDGLAARLALCQETISTKASSGQDWAAILSSKDAEVVRLRAEVNRMRAALSSTNQAHAAQADQLAALQAELNQSLAASRAQQRQSVVTTATADTQTGDLIRLRAELDATAQHCARLEGDIAAQQAAAAARLSELQDSFLAKIADLRRGHQEQLQQAERAAAAAAASVKAPTAPVASNPEQEAQLVAVRQRLHAAEEEVKALRQRLAQPQPAGPAQRTEAGAAASVSGPLPVAAAAEELKAQLAAARLESEASRSALSSLQFSEKALKARLKELEGQLAAAQRQLQQQRQGPGTTSEGGGTTTSGGAGGLAGSAPAGPGPQQAGGQASGIDLGMLGMMEGQLARLSEIIRNKEAEVTQMRGALQAGLEERKELLQQISAYQQQLDGRLQQPTAGNGGGGPGSVSGSGLSSPQGGGGAVAGGVRATVSPSRPYRTGLTSKPKFK